MTKEDAFAIANAVTKKFGAMPFNLRSFESETKAKMGVVECVTHKLVEPFQVLHEKDSKFRGSYIAFPFSDQYF